VCSLPNHAYISTTDTRRKSRFPLGAGCIESNIYVNDIFAGADAFSVAVTKRRELVDVLKSAGIELDKWASNHPELLPTAARLTTDHTLKAIEDDGIVKTHGICWHSRQDAFKFNTQNLKTLSEPMTKRTILSNVVRLFDPLGLCPVTISANVLMQDLRILKCDCDRSLPHEIPRRWVEYCESLEALPSINIDRWLGTSQSQNLQLLVFYDASSTKTHTSINMNTNTNMNTNNNTNNITGTNKSTKTSAHTSTSMIPTIVFMQISLIVPIPIAV
jgi:hypothetical protein